MARLRPLLAPLLAAVLFVQAAGAAAGCLRLAGGASLAIDICSAEASLRTVTLPAGDEDGAPPPAAFCAACHALPAAPAPPAPTAAPSALPLPHRAEPPAPPPALRAAAPAPYRATGPPSA